MNPLLHTAYGDCFIPLRTAHFFEVEAIYPIQIRRLEKSCRGSARGLRTAEPVLAVADRIFGIIVNRHTTEIQTGDRAGQSSLVVCLSFHDDLAHEVGDFEEPSAATTPDPREGSCKIHLALRGRRGLAKADSSSVKSFSNRV